MLTEKSSYWLGGIAAMLLGIIFIVAATGKLMLGSTAFDLFALPSFVPVTLAKAIYMVIPYIELMVGSLLVTGVAVRFAINLSAILIICFAISNMIQIYLGVGECASCFGLLGSITPTIALIFDGIMAVLVMALSYCYRGKSFNLTPWFLEVKQKGREYKYV